MRPALPGTRVPLPLALIVGLFVVSFGAACGERPRSAAPDQGQPAEPAPPPCQHDQDCTGGWVPSADRCGPVERCVEGACRRPSAMTGVATTETGRIVFETPGVERSYQVEVVRDGFEIARGLMCRDQMLPDWGMLFLMSATRPQRFWMKNTLIPLDMLFLDEAWTVVGVVGAEPLTLLSRGVDTPSRYVLELGRGEAARHRIEAGVRARFYPPAGH